MGNRAFMGKNLKISLGMERDGNGKQTNFFLSFSFFILLTTISVLERAWALFIFFTISLFLTIYHAWENGRGRKQWLCTTWKVISLTDRSLTKTGKIVCILFGARK
jgi:hypothetical protein